MIFCYSKGENLEVQFKRLVLFSNRTGGFEYFAETCLKETNKAHFRFWILCYQILIAGVPYLERLRTGGGGGNPNTPPLIIT